ncbi:ABC transporter permease [Ectobacillus sp. sgz5001026]|uniref:ABC transporter permease n=1 Tax=Ectobacillus sp. sgz5001026 TaxID=3242473 RepID=UPI0036D3E85A
MFLGWKEMQRSKLRYFMIGFIIVLIAWLVFILSGLGNGLSTLSAASVKNMNADYVVYQKGAGATFSKSLLSESLAQDIKKQDNVKDVAAFGAAMGAISKEKMDNSADKTDIALLGIEPGSFLEPKIVEGVALDASIKNGVLANKTLKDKGYKLGDTVVASGSKESFKIIGFVENQTYNHLPALFATMEEWRTYQFAAPGANNGIKDVVNAIVVQGTKVDAANIDKQISGIETATKAKAVQGMPGYKEENGTITMMLAFLVVISAFVIAVFFYVLTLQKSNQFGVMKAIGASNRFLVRTIVSQVFVLSFISIAIGVILTYLTALIFPKEMPFSLDAKMVFIYSLVLLLISVVSSLVSVRRVTKIDPLTALGRVE